MATTRDLESQAETDRSQIVATLEELRSRMSTGQLVDQAMAYARGHGGAEFIRNLGDQVKTNPLPVALVAAGIGWLMIGRPPPADRRGYAPSIVPDDSIGPDGKSLDERFDDLARDTRTEVVGALRDSTQASAGRAGSGAKKAASTTFDAMASARDRAQDAAASARDSVSSAYGAATDAVGRASSAVSDTAAAIGRHATDVGHSTAERARRAGDGVAEQAGRTQNAIAQLIREQPLIVGALGLAIGAIFGASLPRSRREDEFMGEASASFKATAAGTAREQFEHLEQAGGRIVEKVRSEAEEHGLTADSAQRLVRDIGAKVSAVAAATKEGAEDELKSAKEQVAAAGESSEEPLSEGSPRDSEKSQVRGGRS